MNNLTKNFKYVDYLWEEKKPDSLSDNQGEFFLYRFNILGADPRMANTFVR